jgi:hypothetical protein
VPLAARSASFGAPDADTIHLFRANLERVASTRAALMQRVHIVMLHETAHFFGYSESALQRCSAWAWPEGIDGVASDGEYAADEGYPCPQRWYLSSASRQEPVVDVV